jgi:hypothetical protein
MINRRDRPTRWTDECTAILKRMSAGGYTDQEIADHIADRTGERFHRNKIVQERRDRLLGTCWASPHAVRRPHGGRLFVRQAAQLG